MELTQEERDKIYAEEKARIEARQQLESEMNTGKQTPPAPQGKPVDNSSLSSGLSYLGVTLLVIGAAMAFYYASIFKVSVPVTMPVGLEQYAPSAPAAVNNLGLMSDRQNGLMGGGVSAVIGTALLLTGLVMESASAKAAAMRRGVTTYAVVLCVICGVMLYMESSAAASGQTVASMMNIAPDPNDAIATDRLKLLGLAVAQYVQDYDETFPVMDTSSNEYAELFSYVRSDDAFNDPESKKPWTFNSNLSEVSLSKLNEPDKDIDIYSPEPYKDGGVWCDFADSHHKKLADYQWAKAQTTITVIPATDTQNMGFTLKPL